MGDNNIRIFQEAIKKNKTLEETFRKELERIDSDNLSETETAAVIKVAKALGFDLTEADMDKVSAEFQTLDPEELKNAGGGGWCWGNYACYTVYHHDGEDEDETCWYDFACMSIHKGEPCEGVYKCDGAFDLL